MGDVWVGDCDGDGDAIRIANCACRESNPGHKHGRLVFPKLDTLGFEPRAFCMRSGCDTTTAKTQMGRGESGWYSNVTSSHGAWRHAGVRFLLLGDFKTLPHRNCTLFEAVHFCEPLNDFIHSKKENL